MQKIEREWERCRNSSKGSGHKETSTYFFRAVILKDNNYKAWVFLNWFFFLFYQIYYIFIHVMKVKINLKDIVYIEELTWLCHFLEIFSLIVIQKIKIPADLTPLYFFEKVDAASTHHSYHLCLVCWVECRVKSYGSTGKRLSESCHYCFTM